MRTTSRHLGGGGTRTSTANSTIPSVVGNMPSLIVTTSFSTYKNARSLLLEHHTRSSTLKCNTQLYCPCGARGQSQQKQRLQYKAGDQFSESSIRSNWDDMYMRTSGWSSEASGTTGLPSSGQAVRRARMSRDSTDKAGGVGTRATILCVDNTAQSSHVQVA